ncbi:MAG: NUDIX hydrolase [Candidatus Izemoplasmataceae bacterium]
MDYIKQIENYTPFNEQERVDQALMLDYIKTHKNALFRENLAAHVTSSAFVLNKTMDKLLFAYHNIYDSWGWVGGHNDGDSDLLKVAIKETKEETGIKTIMPYSEDIFTLDVIYVKNHIKKGSYVSDHLHLNVAFLIIGDESEMVTPKLDENKGVKWFKLDDILKVITEERMINVYQKALDKIEAIKQSKI